MLFRSGGDPLSDRVYKVCGNCRYVYDSTVSECPKCRSQYAKKILSRKQFVDYVEGRLDVDALLRSEELDAMGMDGDAMLSTLRYIELGYMDMTKQVKGINETLLDMGGRVHEYKVLSMMICAMVLGTMGICLGILLNMIGII